MPQWKSVAKHLHNGLVITVGFKWGVVVSGDPTNRLVERW